ncbi:Wzz/FepE/Etk N-terminal domain-containing protein [Aeromonas hydrophila]
MTTSSVSSRQSSAAVENDEIDLGRLLGYLIDGRWWIVTITALFMVLGVAYALLATLFSRQTPCCRWRKKPAVLHCSGIWPMYWAVSNPMLPPRLSC